MDNDVRIKLRERPDLLQYIRKHPEWYRYLSRDPERITDLEKGAKVFYGKTFPQRVEKIGNNLQMLRMFASLAKEMGEDS